MTVHHFPLTSKTSDICRPFSLFTEGNFVNGKKRLDEILNALIARGVELNQMKFAPVHRAQIVEGEFSGQIFPMALVFGSAMVLPVEKPMPDERTNGSIDSLELHFTREPFRSVDEKNSVEKSKRFRERTTDDEQSNRRSARSATMSADNGFCSNRNESE